MKESTPRTGPYAKDPGYESLLSQLNTDLVGLAADPGLATAPQRPCVFIVGLPRCGTTLLYQVLAASGAFGYVTNLNARFYGNPAVGARVQAVAAPLLSRGPFSFRSRGGNTASWYEPHEFGYFWERHLPLKDHHEPSEQDLAAVDVARFTGELATLEAALGRPLLFKNLILDFVLPFVAEVLPTARFLRIRRPLLDVACSIHAMRLEYYGSEQGWFSIRPRDYRTMSDSTAADQIIHQIAALLRALDIARQAISDDRWLEVDYSDLCCDPHGLIHQVTALAAIAPEPGHTASVPSEFRPGGRAGRLPAVADELRRALAARGLSS